MSITLTIEKAENGFVVTRTSSSGMVEKYIFNTAAQLQEGIKNSVSIFE